MSLTVKSGAGRGETELVVRRGLLRGFLRRCRLLRGHVGVPSFAMGELSLRASREVNASGLADWLNLRAPANKNA